MFAINAISKREKARATVAAVASATAMLATTMLMFAMQAPMA